jgi:hypothetical protein
MIKDPLSEFLTIKKNLKRCSGAAGYTSSEEIFSFLNNQDSMTLQFFVPNSKRLEGYTQ